MGQLTLVVLVGTSLLGVKPLSPECAMGAASFLPNQKTNVRVFVPNPSGRGGWRHDYLMYPPAGRYRTRYMWLAASLKTHRHWYTSRDAAHLRDTTYKALTQHMNMELQRIRKAPRHQRLRCLAALALDMTTYDLQLRSASAWDFGWGGIFGLMSDVAGWAMPPTVTRNLGRSAEFVVVPNILDRGTWANFIAQIAGGAPGFAAPYLEQLIAKPKTAHAPIRAALLATWMKNLCGCSMPIDINQRGPITALSGVPFLTQPTYQYRTRFVSILAPASRVWNAEALEIAHLKRMMSDEITFMRSRTAPQLFSYYTAIAWDLELLEREWMESPPDQFALSTISNISAMLLGPVGGVAGSGGVVGAISEGLSHDQETQGALLVHALRAVVYARIFDLASQLDKCSCAPISAQRRSCRRVCDPPTRRCTQTQKCTMIGWSKDGRHGACRDGKWRSDICYMDKLCRPGPDRCEQVPGQCRTVCTD